MEVPFTVLNASQFRIMPIDIAPIEDFEYPTNYPYCCDYHRKAFSSLNSWFELFPNCCDIHRKIGENDWFNKDELSELPKKILEAVTFTINFIQKNIEKPNYRKKITDYYEYVVFSFGHPNTGGAQYVSYVKSYIEYYGNNFPSDRVSKLLAYLNGEEQLTANTSLTDLNTLYKIYQRWLKAFPFRLEGLKAFKNKLENELPILTGGISVNEFTGFARSKLMTESELLDSLNQLTNMLLGSVNTADLYTNGIVTDVQKQRLELAGEALKLKQRTLIFDYTESEKKYLKTLEKWLENEMTYFKEIDLIMNNQKQVINISAGSNSIIQAQNGSNNSSQNICPK